MPQFFTTKFTKDTKKLEPKSFEFNAFFVLFVVKF